MLLRLFSAPSLLCSIHLLPHPLSSIMYSEGTHWFFPGTSYWCFSFSIFQKIRKAGFLFSLFFSLNFLGFFFHPYWKVDGFIVFVFSPRFFCPFSHSIPTRNGAIWWVYYCGIVLCFGLGLYHHESNSKPTHTDDDSVGQSNGSGSGSLYLLLLRDF